MNIELEEKIADQCAKAEIRGEDMEMIGAWFDYVLKVHTIVRTFEAGFIEVVGWGDDGPLFKLTPAGEREKEAKILL